jgi:hypothetical protein
MANFQFNIKNELLLSDGMRFEQQFCRQDANAKMVLDDTYSAGAVIDLSPYLAQIAVPLWLYMVASGNGVTLDFDAIGESALYYKTLILQVCPILSGGPQGPIQLQLKLAVASGSGPQRIQVFAVGFC